MANYDKDTGNAGTLRISVTYSQNISANTTTFTVRFIILCSDPATFIGTLGWDGSISGSSKSGTTSLPAGFGSKQVGAWTYTRTHDSNGNLSAANRRMVFSIDGTGTSGLGGPTTQTVTVPVDRIPQVPGKPGTPTFSDITPTAVTVAWSAASRGHAAIDNYQVQFDESSGFPAPATGSSGTDRTYTSTIRSPGTRYYVRVRAHNSDGYGAWSNTGTFQTLSGAYVSDGSAWLPCEVFVSDGSAWGDGFVQVSDGSSWAPAG